MSDEKPVMHIIPTWDPNEPVFIKKECPQCGDDRQFLTGEVVYNQRLNLAYSVDDLVEVLNALRTWEDKARQLIQVYESILNPIINICQEYNIPLESLPGTLEEYIMRDNE